MNEIYIKYLPIHRIFTQLSWYISVSVWYICGCAKMLPPLRRGGGEGGKGVVTPPIPTLTPIPPRPSFPHTSRYACLSVGCLGLIDHSKVCQCNHTYQMNIFIKTIRFMFPFELRLILTVVTASIRMRTKRSYYKSMDIFIIM